MTAKGKRMYLFTQSSYGELIQHRNFSMMTEWFSQWTIELVSHEQLHILKAEMQKGVILTEIRELSSK